MQERRGKRIGPWNFDARCELCLSGGKERTKSELLKFLSGADLKDYRLSNFRVSILNQDAAVVTYHVDAHASIQGNDVSMKNSVTSGWAKRGDRWLNVFAVASAR